ncbi:MAG: ABC transporter substrate-binding protein [Gammaproteobacteria bacterium]|nr:ABC transporter substrate-binding protein [Gammaproteobacteria bacterium]
MPASAADQPTPIVFASGPDDTGTVQRIIDAFNAEHAGRIEVTWRQMDRDNNTHHDQLVADFVAQRDVPHVIASDVIWTAEFAKNGWVEDVTKAFYDDYDRAAFLGPALESATYRLRIWGVPWYSDASILFYRKDLLAASGFGAPPATWDELIRMSRQVMQDADIRHGFVFQGAEYEGGTANAAEFIWAAGGEVMRGQLQVTSTLRGTVAEMDAVIIESDEAAAGFDTARRLVSEGVAPAEVATYREQESLEAFLAGDAVFLRSWPYVQGVLRESALSSAQVGVSWLPAASAGRAGYSCLGGWNLMINARVGADERAAAWELIRHLTGPAQQKRQALQAGLLPVLEALYEDPEVLESVPIAALARGAMAARIRVRPMTPFYADLSAQIANAFNRVLKGELTGQEAVQALDKDLRAIVARNR